jgi:hypothetical protein
MIGEKDSIKERHGEERWKEGREAVEGSTEY